MIFEKILTPDEMRDSFEDLTPAEAKARGIRFIFSDIDNTLVTYDDPVPTEAVSRWLAAMEAEGIAVIFVSNNDRERVERFDGACPGRADGQLPRRAYWKAGKPLLKTLRRAMKEAGARPECSVLLGDQLLTDAAAGKRAGLYTLIVPPIRDKKTLFWRVKRRIEKPYVKKFRKQHPAGPGENGRADGWEVWL